MAARHGAGYLRRARAARAPRPATSTTRCARTDAPFVVVLDCDHVPEPHFLEATLGYFADERVAFVQTPQYYANWDRGEVPARGVGPAGAVLRPDRPRQGRPRRDVLLRHQRRLPARRARAGRRLPGRLGDRGLRAVDPPARARLALALRAGGARRTGSGRRTWRRTSASSSAGRAAACRRCPPSLRSSLPLRLKVQYALSASYFLSGWTVLVYMSVPGRAAADRRAAAGGHHGGPVPRPLRAVLRAVAAGASRCSAAAPTRSRRSRCRRRASGSTCSRRCWRCSAAAAGSW